MTVEQSIPASASAGRSRSTLVWGGGGFIVAGLLLAVGGLPFALGSPREGIASIWLLLGWPVGGIALVAASIALAIGLRGDDGLVGRSPGRRAALIASGTAPPLLIAVFLLSWTSGPASPVLAVLQLLSFAATAVVAVTLLRRDGFAGAARWAFAGLAVVDAVALVLSVLPKTTPAFQVVVALVRPLAVLVVGVLLVLESRSLRAGSTTRARV